MPAPLIAVDGPYLLYRSFFALPDSIRGAGEHSVNALLGGANVLLRVAGDKLPRAIVVCFGSEAARYRVELFPPYHADRPPVPDALQWQFERAPAFFEAFGWTTENSEELEADDLLGGLATAETAAGGEALILTGDRDMFQCVGDGVSVLLLKSTVKGFEVIDSREVERRYGIPPALVPDFIALRGDPSDSLPGAPGIGAKTAAELLRRHGSLERAIAAAGKVGVERPRIAGALLDSADALRSFREIATLQPVDVERPPDRPTDMEGGARAARALGLNRLAERLEEARDLGDL
jgi:DNA polymerase-1